MISAILTREGNGYSRCRVSGHSGYAEAGSDIICAAVSILTCTCVNALESLLGIRVILRENREGLLDFSLPALEGEASAGAELLMGALGQGLSDLQDTYPGYVKFEIRERRKRP